MRTDRAGDEPRSLRDAGDELKPLVTEMIRGTLSGPWLGFSSTARWDVGLIETGSGLFYRQIVTVSGDQSGAL